MGSQLFRAFFLSALLMLSSASICFASGEQEEMTAEKFEASLAWKTGVVKVGNGIATLNLSPAYRYLEPAQSKVVLEQLWGNPDAGDTLGMIFPSNAGPTAPTSWAVVITFSEDGYVKDEEAEKIKYDDLLKEMQQNTAAESKERVAQGYDSIQLVGWAEPPHYDKASHKLYWAQNLKFGKTEENTLNYNIRVLGRRGVLVLNAVSALGQKDIVAAGMQDVLKQVDFSEGHRYSEFVPGVDKVAAYGIGALILGKVALKVGFLKGFLALLIAGKKVIILGAVAVASFFKRLFKRKQVGESSLSGTTPSA